MPDARLELGSTLSEVELNEVSKKRMGSEWGECTSKSEAITIYDTIKKKKKKKKIQDQLTLVRFFDIGVNLEYNVLLVKFPHYNFLLMLDQSSGHGQMK